MKEILDEVVALLARGERAALATVVGARGSLPMSRRSRMLVLADGGQRGTVGGGCLEADIHAMARLALRSGAASLHTFTLTETKAGREGLNCGGTVEVLIDPLRDPLGVPLDHPPGDAMGHPPGDDPLTVFRQATACMEAHEEAVLATVLTRAVPPGRDVSSVDCRITGRGVVTWKGLRVGCGALGAEGPLTERVVEDSLAILGQDRGEMLAMADPVDPAPGGLAAGTWAHLETLTIPPTLYLFGGGHVSLAVARVARSAGFRIVVVDDRPAFASAERFPEADQVLVMPLDRAVSSLPIGRDAYIVAVTRGHQHDEPIIEQAIRTPAAYIGMIGSRRKVAILWGRLRERGATEEQLSRVHAPIGLPIGGDSPGEIAVSIVAQMIQVRRRPRQP